MVMNRVSQKDPAEAINMEMPTRYETVTRHTFKYTPYNKTKWFKLKPTTTIREASGSCKNNDRYVEPPKDNERFKSHYNSYHDDKSKLALKNRSKHFSISSNSNNGFTKSTKTAVTRKMATMPPWKSADALNTRIEAKKVIMENPALFDATRNYKLRGIENQLCN